MLAKFLGSDVVYGKGTVFGQYIRGLIGYSAGWQALLIPNALCLGLRLIINQNLLLEDPSKPLAEIIICCIQSLKLQVDTMYLRSMNLNEINHRLDKQINQKL